MKISSRNLGPTILTIPAILVSEETPRRKLRELVSGRADELAQPDSHLNKQNLVPQEGYHKECLPGIGWSLIHTAEN